MGLAGMTAPAKAYEVIWPDGGTYSNRHGETVLTEAEAKATARAIGGRWRRAAGPSGDDQQELDRLRAAMAGETPLEGLGETVVHDGAHWTAEGPRGALWIIRWFGSSGTGAVAAWKHPLRVSEHERSPSQSRIAAERSRSHPHPRCRVDASAPSARQAWSYVSSTSVSALRSTTGECAQNIKQVAAWFSLRLAL
jgi:hypothetical protein